MKTSAPGRALIEQREGRRLRAYRDSRGILTIGVGHTGRMAGPAVNVGMTITETQCDAMLAADLAPVEAMIERVVTVPVSQNEFDALASFAFNIGVGGFRASSVVRKLNTGDLSGAADAFMMWCKPAELTGRRAAERKQFLAPDAADAAGASPSRALAAERAVVLKAKATDAMAKAQATTTGGGLFAGAGAAAAIGTAAAHNGHLGAILAVLFGLGAVIDGIVSVVRSKAAQTFSLNAAVQAGMAAAPSLTINRP